MYLYLVIIVYLRCLFTVGQECRQPEKVPEILLQHLKDIYQHPGFMLTHDFLPPSGLDIREGNRSTFAALQTREDNCKKILQRYSSDEYLNLNQISTCPWTVILNEDPDRIPTSISEAECSCDQCVQYDGECSRTKRRPCYAYKGRCEKVYTSKVVIMRHCNQTTGEYQYTSGLLPVAVGCTCSRDVIRHNKVAEKKRPHYNP